MTVETLQFIPEEKLIKLALQALLQALGPVEMTRFLALEQTNRLDSVERHRQWQESLDRTEFYDQLFQA